MLASTNLWGRSDVSASTYSNDEDALIYSKPVIVRKETTSASSAYSAASNISNIYSEDSIKSLGYRPFEYWKGPTPAAAPSKRSPPAPLPPPRLVICTTPMRSVDSLQDIKPLPKARVIEVQTHMEDEAPPPPSPRVKDRYAARMAAHARRKRERDYMQQIEEWPGWTPDEKVLVEQRRLRQLRIAAGVATPSEPASLASSERWLSPRTWRRRKWSVVVTTGVLVLIILIMVATIVTRNNTSGTKTALTARANHRIAGTV